MLGRSLFNICLSVALCLPVSAAVTGCGPSTPEVKHAQLKAGSLPEGGEWRGVYFSTIFGYLHLESDGKTATGAWRTASGDAWGQLSGQIDGDLLRYEWTERKIGAIGADATKKGHGYFRYTIPNPGEPHQIKGEWGLDASDAGNPWDAVKQVRMEPKPESVKPDEIENRTNVGGWDEDKGDAEAPKSGDEAPK